MCCVTFASFRGGGAQRLEVASRCLVFLAGKASSGFTAGEEELAGGNFHNCHSEGNDGYMKNLIDPNGYS